MSRSDIRRLAIVLPYWLGIGADALWAIALFVPPLFSTLTGNPDFDPDQDVRMIMAVGGVLMTGWTILLLWAVRNPIDRRFVILVTAFPVVFGFLLIALVQVVKGNSLQVWIVVKTAVLFASMIGSYVLAGSVIRTQRAQARSNRQRPITEPWSASDKAVSRYHAEKATRFGCGFLFGVVFGGLLAARLFYDNGYAVLAATALLATIAGLAAMAFGDRFWLSIKHWVWWLS